MPDGALPLRVYPIPDAALETHIAILATSGAGKTVAAKGAVEVLMERGERVCVIDPTGVWHGMRTLANGKPGFPFVIFGQPDPRGERHIDVEIGAKSGAAAAELIATQNLPAIFNTLGMTVSARTRFFTDFAEAILNENAEPLHLIIDECHLFMPKGRVNDPASGQMVNAANNLVSGGRARGFSIMLISQRAQKVHNDSLTIMESLVAMRMTHHADQEVVERWVGAFVGAKEAHRIVGTLPSMPTGEGWLYAPTLPKMERIKFPMIRTLDTSARPKPGEKRPAPARLADIDLEAIRASLAPPSAPAPARATPSAGAGRAGAPAIDVEAIERAAFERGKAEGFALGEESGYSRGRASLTDAVMRAIASPPIELQPRSAAPPPPPPVPSPPAPMPHAPRPRSEADAERARVAHSKAGERLLEALARYTAPIRWEEACVATGLLHGNGYFFGGRKWLVEEGLVREVAGGVLATPMGVKRAGGRQAPLTRKQLLALWATRKQPGPRMLEVLEAKPRSWFTTDELAAAIGAKPGNGYWFGGLKALRVAHLIEQDRGSFRLSDFVAGHAP